MAVQPGLFHVEERLRRLSDIGDALEAYAAAVDFELFRPDLEAALGPNRTVPGAVARRMTRS